MLWSPCSYGRTTGLYIEPLGETYHSHGSSTHLPVVDGFALWSERVYNPPLSHSFVAKINVIIFHHNSFRNRPNNEGHPCTADDTNIISLLYSGRYQPNPPIHCHAESPSNVRIQ